MQARFLWLAAGIGASVLPVAIGGTRAQPSPVSQPTYTQHQDAQPALLPLGAATFVPAPTAPSRAILTTSLQPQDHLGSVTVAGAVEQESPSSSVSVAPKTVTPPVQPQQVGLPAAVTQVAPGSSFAATGVASGGLLRIPSLPLSTDASAAAPATTANGSSFSAPQTTASSTTSSTATSTATISTANSGTASSTAGSGSTATSSTTALLAPQPLEAQVGVVVSDQHPETTPVGQFGDVAWVTFDASETSLGLDLGAVHPAVVSALELFNVNNATRLTAPDLALYVSDDNITYRAYTGPLVFARDGHRLTLSHLDIPERFIKVHQRLDDGTAATFANYLTEIIRASGAMPVADHQPFLDDLARRTFNYFVDHLNPRGLMPDRVVLSDTGATAPSAAHSTAGTGFWLAALPIGVERGWLDRSRGEALARLTLETYLGRNGPPVEGQFGFFYHFVNGDGSRFTAFDGDGVSIIDSSLLFLGALASGEYFGGEIQTLARTLVDQADWDAVYDHDLHMLRLVWTPEDGFIRHLDYYSEGIVAYLLSAGSAAHPIAADSHLEDPTDAYYAFSRGNFGRILGRYGRDGRPLVQSFFGSLFTYLYPPLLADLQGRRDAFHVDWAANTREAVLANFRFAQAHPALGYTRLVWGISASDGPGGYQGLYGAEPLDPGAVGGALHDGTVAPYALAGALAFAADLALPALEHLATVDNGRAFGRYGFTDAINVRQGFVDTDYLSLDQGALLLGLEHYRDGLTARLIGQSAVMQRALANLGFHSAPEYALTTAPGPRSAHAYLLMDTTQHVTQTITLPPPSSSAPPGDYLLELHPHGMDTVLGRQVVDLGLTINAQPEQIVRFADRRGTGDVDVGGEYVPIDPAWLRPAGNTIEMRWVDGERWVQLEDVELRPPTGRMGTQETWTIGTDDGSYREFGDERLTDDSYVVGDDPRTFEQALNVVDEPTTDILFELSDITSDRLLRLKASATELNRSVGVEVSLNHAVLGVVELTPGLDVTLPIAHDVLRKGWNHMRLRHANRAGDGTYLLWDYLSLEFNALAGAVHVVIYNVNDQHVVSAVQFDPASPRGAVLPAQQYLEIYYDAAAPFDRMTMATDNRHASVTPFTGPPDASAAGLVGAVDSTVAVPLLWQVYDTRPAAPPMVDDLNSWGVVPDVSDADFATAASINRRTVASREGLGDHPSAGRAAASPIFVYLAADFRGVPAQRYRTDRLIIESFNQ